MSVTFTTDLGRVLTCGPSSSYGSGRYAPHDDDDAPEDGPYHSHDDDDTDDEHGVEVSAVKRTHQTPRLLLDGIRKAYRTPHMR